MRERCKTKCRRCLSILLCAILVFGLFPAVPAMVTEANAAEVQGFTVENLRLDADSNGIWTANGNVISGSLTEKGQKKVLTIQNTSDVSGTISYRYQGEIVSGKGGLFSNAETSANVAGEQQSVSSITITSKRKEIGDSNTLHTAVIPANTSVQIVLDTTKGGNGCKASINITDISFEVDTAVSVTCLPSEAGAYTVNGTQVSSDSGAQVFQTTSLTGLTISAELPGYSCTGFAYTAEDGTSGTLFPNAERKIYPQKNCKIEPLFIKTTGEAPFKVGDQLYFTWETAMGSAIASSRTVEVVAKHYALPATLKENGVGAAGGTYVNGTDGNLQYIIPSGVTLILPYEAGKTAVDVRTESVADHKGGSTLECANKVLRDNSHPHKADYLRPNLHINVTLEIPAGMEMINEGKLVIGGELLSDTGIACAPCGSHSNLVVNGTLRLRGNSISSVCGYILGSGRVLAENGANIYQPFTVMDYRGGGYTTSTITNTGLKSGENAISPFARYTMAGIQAELTMSSGARMYGYCSLHTGAAIGGMIPAQHNVTAPLIIGGQSDNALLKLSNGSTLSATYDTQTVVAPYPAVGRSIITIVGGGSMGTLSLAIKVAGIEKTVTTNGLTFPLPYNFEFNLNGRDSTYELGYALGLMPGSTLRVGEGATLNVSNATDSQAFRFAVYDGLNDHTTSSAEIAYNGGKQTYLASPNTENLQKAGLTGTANLIVAGTLNIGPNVQFGGVVQADGDYDSETKTGPRIRMDAAAKPQATVQTGLIGDIRVIKTYAFGGATVRTMKAQVLDTTSGQRLDMQPGLDYYGASGDSIIDTFTYQLYSKSSAPNAFEEHTEPLGAQVDGSWWNYDDITIVTVDAQGQAINSNTAKFSHGANVSGYFLDAGCEQPATIVDHSGMTLYQSVEAMAARIDWADTAKADTYYPTLAQAVKAARSSGDTVVLLKSPYEITSSIPVDDSQNITIKLADNAETPCELSYSVPAFLNKGNVTFDIGANCVIENAANADMSLFTNNGGNMTVNLAGGRIMLHSMTAAPIVNNSGTMTLDLGGGSIVVDQPVAGLGAASAVVENSGSMTLTSTGAKGTLTTSTPRTGVSYAPIAPDRTETMAAVVRTTNGTLTVSNVTLNQMAATPETAVGIVCSGNGHIQSVTNTDITVPNGQAMYNLGGKIDIIEGCTMKARHGIWNRNGRHGSNNGNVNPNNRFEVSPQETATIGSITDTSVTATSYHALWNGGKINCIGGNSVLSATHQTIYNTSAWFYDTMYYQYKDSGNTRTYMTSAGRENLPTIGSITGNAQVLTTIDHFAILNDGVVNEISGNTKIQAKKNYAIQNRSGGYVGEISGNAALSSAYQTILLSGQREGTRADLYYGTDQNPSGIAGQIKQRNYTYGNVSAIGTISGNVDGIGVHIESTGSYALYLDGGSVDTISGKTTIYAKSGYAIQITESGGNAEWQGNWNYDPAVAHPTGSTVRQTYVEEYSTNLTEGRRINSINGSSVLIEAGNYPAMGVGGWIDKIQNGVTIKSNRVGDWGPCLTISGTQRTKTKVVSTNEGQITETGENSGKYLTRYDRTYTCDAVNHPAGIGTMDGVVVESPTYYAIQNSGKIGTMHNCTITGTSSVVRNEAGGTRNGSYSTVQHYFGTEANSAAWSNRLYDERILAGYETKLARIDLIDGCTIHATTGGSAVNNAGSIGTIVNSTITAKNDRAISNTEPTQMSFVNNTYAVNSDGYLIKNAAGRWTFPKSYQETRTYAPPVIENLSGGNTIQAATNAVINGGVLTQVGDPAGKATTITATGGVALYNYQGTIDSRVRTVEQDPIKGTDIGGTNKDTYTYGASASIGKVQNVEVTGTSYAVLNGDGNGTYTGVSIGELGEGIIAKSTNHDSYAVKSNANAQIDRISGGDYKGGMDDREHAIASPDTQSYPQTPDSMTLSKATHTVTRANGTTEPGFYYITRNGFYIKFKPNGGTGTMPGSTDADRGCFVPLNDPNVLLSYVPQNQFANGTKKFRGWKINPNGGEADITGDLPNNVTVNALKEVLKPVAPTIDVGTEIVLYAHWFAPDAKNYTVEFGKLDYAFAPTYIWDPNTLQYKSSGQWNVIPDEGTSPVVPAGQIRVSNQSTAPITAQFSFLPTSNLNWPTAPGMTFMRDNAPGTSFIVPGKNGLLTVNAMLTGTPPSGQDLNVIRAGAVTVTIQENTSP